jgi:LysM repeat protein
LSDDKLIRSLKLQLRLERTAILLVALFFLIRWGYGNFQSRPYSISINGKPIAYVTTSEAAKRVLANIKGAVQGIKASDVSFKENITINRAPRNVNVLSETDAEKAVVGKLTLRVMKYAILVEGVPAVAVDSEEQAGAILESAKERFGLMVDNLMEEPGFKEQVEVRRLPVNLSIYRTDADEALKMLLEGRVSASEGSSGGSSSTYMVASGDVAGKIAADYGMTLDELQQLNPEKKLDKLQIGEELKVKTQTTTDGRESESVQAPRLTVVVRSREKKTEDIPYTTETVSSMRMSAGKEVELSPGRNGRRQIVLATVYENGVKKGSEIVEETILRNPTPRRVSIGIRSR